MSMALENQERMNLFKRFLMVAYGLSEGDVDILLKVISKGEVDVETLSEEIKISKSRVSLILKKLSDIGLAERKKQLGGGGGRPKLIYSVDKREIKQKLENKSRELCGQISEAVKSL